MLVVEDLHHKSLSLYFVFYLAFFLLFTVFLDLDYLGFNLRLPTCGLVCAVEAIV